MKSAAFAADRRRLLALLLAGAAPGARAHKDHGPARAGPSLQVLRPQLEPLPRLPLMTMEGRARRLDSELATDCPLVLNFVFTTCSSSCSVQTALLADVQRRCLAAHQKLQLASITIDPDNDTPEQLRRFAQRFGVGPGWEFYTGRFDDLLQVQRHFDVYRGSKASHPPVLLMRRDARAPWLRVEGFPASGELVSLIATLPAGA